PNPFEDQDWQAAEQHLTSSVKSAKKSIGGQSTSEQLQQGQLAQQRSSSANVQRQPSAVVGSSHSSSHSTEKSHSTQKQREATSGSSSSHNSHSSSTPLTQTEKR